MNFGEKLRQLRVDKELTQPDLASAIGIEQSYLSKLETGKSTPSAEVFAEILEFFGVEIGELIRDMDQPSRLKLRQIPSVADYYSSQRDLIIGSRRRWLLVACISAAIGVGLVYVGYDKLLVPETVYEYVSDDSRRLTRDYRGSAYFLPVDGGTSTWELVREVEIESWVNKAAAALGLVLASFGLMLLVVERKLTRFQ